MTERTEYYQDYWKEPQFEDCTYVSWKAALTRARTALRELDEQGKAITFQAVARQAKVSRQWLYQQPDLRAEICRLRAAERDRPTAGPARERSTEASLRSRVQSLLDENQRLRTENTDLKTELAIAYGQQREARAFVSNRVTNLDPLGICLTGSML